MLLLLIVYLFYVCQPNLRVWGTAGQQQSRMILLQTSGNAAKKKSPPHAAHLNKYVTVTFNSCWLVLFCAWGGLASYTCC